MNLLKTPSVIVVGAGIGGMATAVHLAQQGVRVTMVLKPLAKHYDNMAHYFNNPRLKAAFTFQDVYMGLSPFEAPATFSMMQYTELAHGVWYPKGGMYRIVEALLELAVAAGVEFEFGTAVSQIAIKGSEAKGVVLEDGRYLNADAVVANADLPYVYQNPLPANGTSKQMQRKRYNLVKGSTHGLGHTLMQLGYLRPHNRHAHYHNLYFVGASTHPGTGVPTALVSGRLTAVRLLQEMGVHNAIY